MNYGGVERGIDAVLGGVLPAVTSAVQSRRYEDADVAIASLRNLCPSEWCYNASASGRITTAVWHHLSSLVPIGLAAGTARDDKLFIQVLVSLMKALRCTVVQSGRRELHRYIDGLAYDLLCRRRSNGKLDGSEKAVYAKLICKLVALL